VEFAIAGRSAVMPAIRRLSDSPYRWDIIAAPLAEVANQEKLLPPDFISDDGFRITDAAIWRRSSLAKPIRHLRMAYPTM
jgi:ATP-dependent phosphofructokinase / diphosphate-dependent phosphofructokinase